MFFRKGKTLSQVFFQGFHGINLKKRINPAVKVEKGFVYVENFALQIKHNLMRYYVGCQWIIKPFGQFFSCISAKHA